MRVNPFVDLFAFLTRPSYGEPVFMTVLYWIVALTTLAVAITAAVSLQGQTSGYHVGRFIVRFIVGSNGGSRPCGNFRRTSAGSNIGPSRWPSMPHSRSTGLSCAM
jgi:hypothetical protein